MNIKRLIQGIATALILMPIIASAAGSGWYIAADVGQSRFSDVAAQADQIVMQIPQLGVQPSSVTNSDTGYRLTGGFQVNPYLGLEFSFVNFGQATITENNAELLPCGPNCFVVMSGTVAARLKAHAWTLAGTGMYPLNDDWSLWAHIGIVNANMNLAINVIPPVASYISSIDESSSGRLTTTYGLGVRWIFSDHWSARLGWDQYRNLGNSNTIGEYTVNLDSIGIVYRF